MASLFTPDGRYMMPVPCWITIEPRPGQRYLQMHLPTRMLVNPMIGVPESAIQLKTITLEVGQHQNGTWKFRFMDLASLNAFLERAAEEERWL